MRTEIKLTRTQQAEISQLSGDLISLNAGLKTAMQIAGQHEAELWALVRSIVDIDIEDKRISLNHVTKKIYVIDE